MDQYFATLGPDKIVPKLDDYVTRYNLFNRDAGVVKRMWKAYRHVYGLTRDGLFNSSEVGAAGEQGEYSRLKVGHFRNIFQHLLVTLACQRPALQPVATNNDYASEIQTKDAQALLDYIVREKKLDMRLLTLAELALLFGAAWLVAEWDASEGPDVRPDAGPDGQPGQMLKAGDINFDVLSPLDVIVDYTRHDANHDWVVVRRWANKFDLAAKWANPQSGGDDGALEALAGKIIAQQPPRDFFDFRSSLFGAQSAESRVPYENSERIPVYQFFHRSTPSVPGGRQVLFLHGGILLCDYGPLTYRQIPAERFAIGEVHGTPHGYSFLWDLMALQESVDALNSIILSGQKTFGLGCVAMPDGYEVSIYDLGQGLAAIPYNASIGKPEPLNVLNTPKEIFEFLQQNVRDMETLSGVSSVLRGSEQRDLSGSAMALLDSKASQFASGAQANFASATERIGTLVLQILQDNLSEPVHVAISGMGVNAPTKPISGQDIAGIKRVMVDSTNALSKTLSGRMAIAQDLLNAKLIEDPEQYLELVGTGRLDPLIQSKQKALENIKLENEMIARGQNPNISDWDDHRLHLKEHATVATSPAIRQDIHGPAMQALMAHQHAHLQMLLPADPMSLAALMATGQQALPMAPILQALPAAPPGGPPPQGGAASLPPPGPPTGHPAPHGRPPAHEVVGGPSAHGPPMPKLPINPATGQRVEPPQGRPS